MSARALPAGGQARRPGLLRPGHNCWRRSHASRARLLIDGAAYFQAFRDTARRARQSLCIVGWDVDGRFALRRGRQDDGMAAGLRAFLLQLLRARPGLRVYVLDWDFPVWFAPQREWPVSLDPAWHSHPRLHFRLDACHPPGGSHHQKVVVVDDTVAFAGGLDFALGRWDTPEHRSGDPRRADGNRPPDQPYHDVQCMVEGPVATELGALVRERWLRATGESLTQPIVEGGRTAWPPGLEADFGPVTVGIARTLPAWAGQPRVREIEQLLVDAIGAAERCIYIENQYFTAHRPGQALESRLREADGPEVVVVLPREVTGWLAHLTLDVLRERLLKRLLNADRHGRLRVYCPRLGRLETQSLNVHSKLMVVDEQLLRVGSANFNNRSMGLDSECDLVLEAAVDNDPATGHTEDTAAVIGRLRDSLLAEHLGVPPARFTAEHARRDSLIGAIEALRGAGRTLRPYRFSVPPELDALVPAQSLADPERPLDSELIAEELARGPTPPHAWNALLALGGLLLLALGLAAAWRWAGVTDAAAAAGLLRDLNAGWARPLLVVLVYVLAGLVAFPVTLLIVATGAVYGALEGSLYALAGSGLSALLSFGLGRALGRRGLSALPQRWTEAIERRLRRQGLLAIITLRVVPVAPFTFVNLLAGASSLSWRDFALGTFIGMAPGILGLTVFSDQVVSALRAPTPFAIGLLSALALVLVAGSWLLGRWLLRRQRTRPVQPRRPGD